MSPKLWPRWLSTDAPAYSLVSSPTALAAAVGTLLVAVYLQWSPLSPDLAAQFARTGVVHRAGNVSWWTGWFGGVSLPDYSVLAPASMAAFGIRACGVAAALAGAVAMSILVRDALRPRAGAVAFAVAGFADLVDGRVTFVIGLAIAAWALVALRSHWNLAAVVLAVGAYLASPLAGLFLGLVFLAVIVVDRSRRLGATVGAGCLLAPGTGMAVLFPGTGVMPFGFTDAIPPAVGCVVVALLCPSRLVKASALLALLALPAFLIVPGAIGGNIGRFAWVAAAPVIIACCPMSWRRVAGFVVLLAAWPASDLVEQLTAAAAPSAGRAFYLPLATELTTERHQAGTAALGQRVEVVDTVNHWASTYLSNTDAVARGWDRQADVADNPIFYLHGALTPATYRSWLDQLAVGWVAVPTARLDYASVREGQLINNGLDYLHLTWSSPHWRLYRVQHSTPLATGAAVVAVTTSNVTLAMAAPGAAWVRVRWSAYLTVLDPLTLQPVPACITNVAGWTRLDMPHAGTFALTSRFNLTARFHRTQTGCTTTTRN